MKCSWPTLVTLAGSTLLLGSAPPARTVASPQFTISFPASLHAAPITGRAFIVITRDSTREPRLQAGSYTESAPFFGVDVSALAPGQAAIIGDTTLGYPVASLRDIPPGDYYVQAVLSVYTEFHRADGHTVWAHMDQWEGQHFNTSPGNLVSQPMRVHLDARAGYTVPISLTRVLPPVQETPDTKWVKHVKIQSRLLTKFWGHPMYLGAIVLLPKGYDAHPDVHYPVVYEQGHFSLRAPFGFTTDSTPMSPQMRARLSSYNRESGSELYKAWISADAPRMIAVTFQHPTPYYDDSYAVNSANDGPYGDAIMQELIPYIESHFRIIRQPYARVLTGGSTGGWESLALQIYHPDFFGGTWSLYPDPVDLHRYQLGDIYADTNAFVVARSDWFASEIPAEREPDGMPTMTMRQESQLEAVLGSHGRSAEQLEAWEAVYGPVGDDGYPKPLWDKRTGHIDHSVAEYMRDHGYDLHAYLAKHWSTVGPQLVDKIHVDVGDMDNYYLNLAVMRLQAFLDSTQHPHVPGVFHYGRPMKGHGWQHTTTAAMLREMAAAIERHAPAGKKTAAWMY